MIIVTDKNMANGNQDTKNQNLNNSASGSDQSVPAASAPPEPPPVPEIQTANTPINENQVKQTVVVPTGAQSDSSDKNTYNPTVTVSALSENTQSDTTTAKAPKKGGGFVKFLIILIILGAVIFGGWKVGQKSLPFLGGFQTVTISYWGLWENDSIIKPIIDDFETQNPKIKVEYIRSSPRQYRERLSAAINRGEGPDVFRFHNTWVPMLVNSLDLVPATIMDTTQFGTDFYEVINRDLVAGTRIYGIPIMIDGLGLYINEDIFAASGANPPQTWEDVLSLVPLLTVKDGVNITTSAIALGTTGNIENYSDIVATMMMQNGVNLTQPTGQEAEEALIFYRKFADPADPVYTWNETMDNSIVAFANGRVAMIMAPSWRAFDIKEINPNTRFRIVPIPQLPGNTVTWASYWVEGVSSKSKNKDQAWEFVKYLTSKDTVTKLYSQAAKYRLFGEPYARVELGSSLANDPYVESYIKQATSARSFPLASRTGDNGINDKLIKYLEDAVNGILGGSSPTDALNTMSSGFSQVFSQYGLSTSAAPN